MKSFVKKTIHFLFRLYAFEKLLRFIVKDKYVNSFAVKLIPPSYTYKKGEYRLVKQHDLVLHADLHDYNDWKAYWQLKESERENLYQISRGAATVIDVGTNNGWVLMNLCLIVSPDNGFVYGFEPHPDSYSKCVKNVKDSKLENCRVINKGCSDRIDELVMVAEIESNSGQNRIDTNRMKASGNNEVKIQITTLDNELGDIGDVDLIKIDVEGFEFNVIKGSMKLLEKHHPVLFIEVDDKLLRANNTSPMDLLSFLKDGYGYSFTKAASGKEVKVSDNFSGCHMDVICRVHSI